jgi:ATP-binding cassette subfamily F protein 3
VQSRIKQLDKVERIEIEEEDTASVHFRFPDAPRSGRMVFEAEGVVKSFGEKTVLRGIDFAVERGEKIAFVGKNGEGKTTFSKMLVGQDDVSGGTITLGHNVSIGYYAQHQAEMLDPNATVLDIIDRAATGEMRTKIRDLLGAFLFSGDSVYKKVRVLSGGEKSRLAMAKLLLEPVNALVLDEPTNHLDMRSKDVLKQALMDYDGALIVVSHDRDFLQGLTGKVVEFRGGNIKEFAGDIYEFLRLKNMDTLRELEATKKTSSDEKRAANAEESQAAKPTSQAAKPTSQAAPTAETPNVPVVKPIATTATAPTSNGTPAPTLDREERKRLQREERKLAKQIEDCEAQISKLEKEIAATETAMQSEDFYAAPNVQTILTAHDAKRKELDAKVEEWSALSAEREELLALGV